MTVFKERVEHQEETPIEVPKIEIKSDELKGYEDKATDPITEEEKKLEIWEGLNKTKFINDYFDVKNTVDGDFALKMQTSVIDKFIKGELERKGYEKNIDNYKSVLEEIENEIGSNRLELFKRITKLTGYIKVLNKFTEAKRKKELYIQSDD